MDRKKDFQAVIAAIRADTGKDYPKAMMNSKQEMNDTATVKRTERGTIDQWTN